jgi:hypothetical protein
MSMLMRCLSASSETPTWGPKKKSKKRGEVVINQTGSFDLDLSIDNTIA